MLKTAASVLSVVPKWPYTKTVSCLRKILQTYFRISQFKLNINISMMLSR